jgi:hypothetical protein
MQIMVRTVRLWESTKQETSGVKVNNLFPANTWVLNLTFQPTTKNYNDLNEIANFYVVCIVVYQYLGFIVSDAKTEMALISPYISRGNIQHQTHSI